MSDAAAYHTGDTITIDGAVPLAWDKGLPLVRSR